MEDDDIPFNKEECISLAIKIYEDMQKDDRDRIVITHLINKLSSDFDLFKKYFLKYNEKSREEYEKMKEESENELQDHIMDELMNDSENEINYNKGSYYVDDFGEDD